MVSGDKKSCGCIKRKLPESIMENHTCGTFLINLKCVPSVKNKSGIVGVCYSNRIKKWIAEIQFQKKKYWLGNYNEKQDAVLARKLAEDNLFGNFLKWYYETYPEKKKIVEK